MVGASFVIAACGGDSSTEGGDTTGGDAGGDTTLPCTATCEDEGTRSCDGDRVLTCGDSDDDGCLEWSEILTCGAGTTCVDGTCGVACPDAPCNAAGARRCEGTAVATCGDSDDDGCLDWGEVSACEDELVCANGFCAISCADTCTAVGARKCEAGGVVTCDDHDDNGCLEWGAPVACQEGESCSGGFCAADCADECTSVGATRCDGSGVSTCGQFDADACLEWGTVVACDPGERCSNGACATTCTSECSTLGARVCDGNRTKVCEDPDGDGCYRWTSPVPCGEGLVCASGQCASTCSDECTVVGAKACDLGGRVITCGNHDSDTCLEWSEGVGCGDNLVCAGGNCAVTCTSTCAAVGLRQCASGTTSSYEVCDDYNTDGCLEWGTPESCGEALVCAAGQCETSCSNECSVADETSCDGNAVRTCGDYNADGCLEFGTAVSCSLTETCQAGACEALEPPATVIINEVLLNSPGSPDVDTFLELHGPPGTDLTGYTVVGVNGNGGADYVSIPLSGTIASDGLFVVTHPQAKPSIADMSDLEAAGVDFQNGPDSIQVRFGATVLDALGYGSFDTGDVFAGEGSPATIPGVDEVLARDADHTDTNDNAADFAQSSVVTPGAGNASQNLPPIARVTCPTAVQVGASREVDGSASSDPDGSIVAWRFNFGDGTPALSGVQATATHTWATAGNFVVTLTVTDDGGLTHAATCQVAVTDGDGPVVTLIKPADQLQVTQGDTFSLLADANPAAGRTIVEVTFWAGDVLIATDEVAPFEAAWTVPAESVTGTTIAVEARARDSEGAIGVSPARTVRIENDPPVAAFTATVTGALQVTADASASYDTETAPEALEVRWDWENDGVWDTQWSTTRRVTRTYPSTGTRTLRVEVRDGVGQTATAVRSVDLALVQTASGTVETTTWAGTVVISGDIVVPAGHTLSIAAGTSVLFAPVDQAGDGVGDYDILVNGALDVQGTAAAPVVFTTYGTEAKAPQDWNGVILKGVGSVVRHAVIEYAHVGLVIENDAQVADLEIRSCYRGIQFSGSGTGSRVDRAHVHGHVDHGVVGLGTHTGVLAESTVARNGGHGLSIAGSAAVSLTDSLVRDNALAGVEYTVFGRGSVTRNNITSNGYEGLRISTSGGPGPVVHFNNIYGNASVGARVVAEVDVAVSSTTNGSGTLSSPAWTAPSGGNIDFVWLIYTESDSSSSSRISGSIVHGSSNTSYFTTSTARTRWVDLTGFAPVDRVRTQVADTSSSYAGTARVTRVAYTLPGAVAEVSVVTEMAVDLRFNHWGTFESPLPVAAIAFHDYQNFQGFRGVAYDSSWTRGPWVGGDELTVDTEWTGDIYVTGMVLTAPTATLTIAQGTTVRFAPVDQDGNGIGDYGIQTGGPLIIDGASGARATFTSLSSAPAPGHWNQVLASNAATVRHAEFAFGTSGFGANGTTFTQTLADIETHDHLMAGMRLMSVRTGTVQRITSHSNGTSGIELSTSGAAALTLDRLVCRDNARHGLAATSVSGSVAVTHGLFTNNGGLGLSFTQSSLAVSQSEVSYNREGVRYYRNSAGSLTASDIKFNDREGIVLLSGNAASPSPVINGNNIFGNAVEESSVLAAVDLVASSTTTGSGTVTSSIWRAPGDALIHAFQATYTESDSSSSSRVSADVIDQSAESLMNTSTARVMRFYDGWSQNVTSIRARVNDTSSSYSGTLTVSQVLHEGGTAAIELAALVDTGTVDVKGNYWGVFPDVQSRMTLSRSNAVDFQGFQIGPITGTGPQ